MTKSFTLIDNYKELGFAGFDLTYPRFLRLCVVKDGQFYTLNTEHHKALAFLEALLDFDLSESMAIAQEGAKNEGISEPYFYVINHKEGTGFLASNPTDLKVRMEHRGLLPKW